MNIRFETSDDIEQIRAVNLAAFETDAEANLVDKLRETGIDLISLVAEENGEVIGYILFSPVTIDHVTNANMAGLAPMAIVPGWQRKGVGSQLVKKGLKICEQAAYDAVVVLGHATYYPRFGFTTAAEYGIKSEYDVPKEVFMIKELKPGGLQNVKGIIKYHHVFSQF